MQNSAAIRTSILLFSWLLTSAIGAVYLYFSWLAKGSQIHATTRALAFIAIMGCVHFVGYCAYEKQHFGYRWFAVLLAPEYKPALKSSVIQQLCALVLSALTLDFGLLLRCCLISVLAYWLVAALIVTRRPSMPTAVDVHLIRYGFLPIFIAVAIVGPVVWRGFGLP
jgi:hypothetical protein